MEVLRFMAILIDKPWLALILAALFGFLFAASKSRWALATGILWLVYAVYECAMKYRILCSGECNIRIDLLAIYPALLLLSIAGLLGFAYRVRRFT